MHGVLLARQQLDQSPEGVFFVHVDEQQGRDLAHPLTVAHLLQRQPHSALGSTPSHPRWRAATHRVVDGVGRQDVEERLLPANRAMEDSGSAPDLADLIPPARGGKLT